MRKHDSGREKPACSLASLSGIPQPDLIADITELLGANIKQETEKGSWSSYTEQEGHFPMLK